MANWWPSASKAKAVTSDLCPGKMLISSPDRKSNVFVSPSAYPTAMNRLFGEAASLVTSDVSPVKTWVW